jgi:hypothetical protein
MSIAEDADALQLPPELRDSGAELVVAELNP